ncbi:MAG: HAD hydrolase-like protein [Acidobacteriaceae bacterium]|jgi:phosphoglycolate phosphatase
MLPRLLVFDLDGTLIDSRIDLSNSINAMLSHLGKPELPHAVIASYIGDGAAMLVRRALGDPEGDVHDQQYVEAALTHFLDYYRIHKLDFTYVYPGVFEALEAIRHAHPTLPMAVLTNKPVRPSRDICAHFGLNRFFFQNYGGNSFHTKKPDPTGLLALIAEASALNQRQSAAPPILPSEIIMIGDSDVDILTARNCGARSIGCTFGLAPHTLAAAQPDALSHSPADWPQVLTHIAESWSLQ